MLVFCIASMTFFRNEKSAAQQIQFARNYSVELSNAAHGFVQLKDSGFIIAGGCGAGSINKGLLMRIDKYGDTVWVKKCDWSDDLYGIEHLNDTAVIVTGVHPIITIWAYSINGDSLWSKSYDSSSTGDYSLRIYKTADQGYIMTNAATDYGFLKIDSVFNEQWHDYQYMPGGGTLYPDIDGGYLGGGGCGGAAIPYQVQRRDSPGNVIWNHCYGNMPGNTQEYYETGLVILPDSNYLITCSGYDWDAMKIDRNTGDTIWTKTLSFITAALGLDYYTMNRFLLVTPHAIYIVNENLDTIWSGYKPLPINVSNIKRTSDGGFAYCGSTFGSLPQQRFLTFVKYDSLGNTVFTSVFNPENNLQPLSFYPNPASNEINISPGNMAVEKNLFFTLCDLQGRIIFQQKCDVSKPIDVSTLPEGLYIASLKGKEKEVRGKVIVQR